MKFTRENLKKFRDEFQEKMKELEEKHEIQVSLGNIRFDDTQFTSKMTVLNLEKGKPEEGSEESYDAKRLQWNIGCNRNPILQPEWLGKIVFIKGTSYIVDGYKIGARKNCVIVKRIVDCRPFVISASTLASII